jgi:hypothetical protein
MKILTTDNPETANIFSSEHSDIQIFKYDDKECAVKWYSEQDKINEALKTKLNERMVSDAT